MSGEKTEGNGNIGYVGRLSHTHDAGIREADARGGLSLQLTCTAE